MSPLLLGLFFTSVEDQFKYIVNEILKPAGLSFDNVYATNLIKCRFPNNHGHLVTSSPVLGLTRCFMSPLLYHNQLDQPTLICHLSNSLSTFYLSY